MYLSLGNRITALVSPFWFCSGVRVFVIPHQLNNRACIWFLFLGLLILFMVTIGINSGAQNLIAVVHTV